MRDISTEANIHRISKRHNKRREKEKKESQGIVHYKLIFLRTIHFLF